MSTQSITIPVVPAREAYDLLTDAGIPSGAVASVLARAERHGADRYGDITVAHTGYVSGAREYHAGTATYRLTTR